MGDRPDAQGVYDGPEPDGAPEQPAADQHGHLDGRAHDPDRMPAGGQAGHQPVARAGPQPGADVRAGGDPVQQYARDHHHHAGRVALHRRHGGEHDVDHQADHDHVVERSEARSLAQWDPQEQDEHAHDDGPGADRQAEPARQALVQHVPRIDAQSGQEQHRVADPVQDQTGIELGQPADAGWAHGMQDGRNGLYSRRPICYKWRVTPTSTHRLIELLGSWRQGGGGRERLATALRSLILEGGVAVESRLPAERTLAAALGVSRATVTGAYDRLREQGYVESRQGAGSWVTLPGGHRSASDAIVVGPGLDMRIAALPAPAVLEELFAAAARELPRWLDHHGYDPLGMPPLRRAIAARFDRRGMPTRPEQILVTNGALHALDLVIRTALPQGRRMLVELPSYP